MKANKIYNMDCIEGMKLMDDCSIDCCVTSPPYWGLRDYGNENQIGLESSPSMYVQELVKVFNEVNRVLKKDGTLWLNLGDSYCSSRAMGTSGNGTGNGIVSKAYAEFDFGRTGATSCMKESNNKRGRGKTAEGLKQKDLVGIPWMVAFALREAGWYLRQDIIWNKPNPMPESVQDRCTKAHEYIFLLSKNDKYYYNYNAIKEPAKDPKFGMKNKRSVWEVPIKALKNAHFATFPEKLILPCILAGCPENGTVLDVFMGSGTTGVVAKSINRNYIGFELNKEYCAIAEERLLK